MRILAIETSCDDTAAAVVDSDLRVLASVVSSQNEIHARFGGIVPELASRRHIEMIRPVVDQALAEADTSLDDIDLVAATRGPGLVGSLLVGFTFAKALALVRGLPAVGVDHMAGHLLSCLLTEQPPDFPYTALIVSGGNTALFAVEDPLSCTRLGRTRDDAAGEAFDKVAKLLDLGYPGGPVIDAAASGGDPRAIAFLRGLTSARDLAQHRFDFSFSGLKTAVSRWVELRRRDGLEVPVADVAASFQEAVADVLTAKAMDLCDHFGLDTLLLGGGVAANSRLRGLLSERADAVGVVVRRPRPGLCTDNGAMMAALGAEVVRRGHRPSSLDIGADPGLPVSTVLV